MKLSTARRLVCMSYFTVDGLRPLLATATRIVCTGDTKRFLFPDGSVIESTKGNWKVVGMEKNPKLEAAVRRFGNGQKLPVAPFAQGGYTGPQKDEGAGVVAPGAYTFAGTNAERLAWLNSGTNLTFEGWITRPNAGEAFTAQAEIYRLAQEVVHLQELCNEKDEQIDALTCGKVKRIDWSVYAIIGLVIIAIVLGLRLP